MLESYKWMGWVWVWDGMGWKSLKGVILRAPLCGANKAVVICLDAFLEKDILCTSIALQVSSYEVGISSPKYRFPKARVVLLNVAVSCLNVCLWSKWSISCISDSVHDYSSNILRFLYWMINIL